MNYIYQSLFLISLFYIYSTRIISISDKSEFKKVLKSHSNILAIFYENDKSDISVRKLMIELDEQANKYSKLVSVDCQSSKKLCKYLKIKPKEAIIQHYNKGKFNKIYDRKVRLQSLIRFLEDPTGDIPWEEDESASDIRHIKGSEDLQKIVKNYKTHLPSLVMMFYAPWCGFCKTMKPVFAAVATSMKSSKILFLGINGDLTTTEELKQAFNITGYPSIFLVQEGNRVYKYENENSKETLIKFIKDPTQPTKPAEVPWSQETDEIAFLTDDTFDEYINKYDSVLVMFYAPWCGFCKKIKPDIIDAVQIMKKKDIPGKIAAVDSTENKNISEMYKITGFPTLKYFQKGQYQYDVSHRTTDTIVEFMSDPKEPIPPPKEVAWKDESSDKSLVLHPAANEFRGLLKQKKHALVMFYAPWCGHCKQTKPEFNEASLMMREETKVAFVGVDCTDEEIVASQLCQTESIDGYPTLRYYNYGKTTSYSSYSLERNADDFVAFLTNPKNPQRDPRRHWRRLPGHEAVLQLTSDSFVQDLVTHGSAGSLIMFYAPWCGHCTEMKPAFIKAAQTLKDKLPSAFLGAVDATEEKLLATQYKVTGFPTLIYFKPSGDPVKYVGGRSAEDIVNYMIMRHTERLEEAERQRQEEQKEAQRRAAEEDEKRRAEEAKLKEIEDEKRRIKEEEISKERNKRQKEEEEAKKREIEKENRRLEEERKLKELEEENRRREERELQKELEEENRRREEEAKKSEIENENRRLEEERKLKELEEENRRREEERELQKELEEENRRQEEEAKKSEIENENRRVEEEETKRKDKQQRNEEKLKMEQEERDKEEEAKRNVKGKAVRDHLRDVDVLESMDVLKRDILGKEVKTAIYLHQHNKKDRQRQKVNKVIGNMKVNAVAIDCGVNSGICDELIDGSNSYEFPMFGLWQGGVFNIIPINDELANVLGIGKEEL